MDDPMQPQPPEKPRVWELEEYLEYPALAAAIAHASLRRTGTQEHEVVFGPHPHQHVLLYLPGEGTIRRNSLVYFVHGGGWRTFGPEYFRFVGRFFARRGFPALLGGYRLAPENHYPAQMDDLYLGFTTGMQAARQLGLKTRKIILGGQSAGAQLAAMALLDREESGRQGLPPDWVAGYFSISGPLDFSACHNVSLRKMIGDYAGSSENWDHTDPIGHIRGDETIPVLLVHGGRDHLVDIENAINFAKRYNLAGRPLAHLHVIPKGHHADLAELFTGHSEDTQVLLNWVEARDRE
jgi:acetyl esterase/lipase